MAPYKLRGATPCSIDSCALQYRGVRPKELPPPPRAPGSTLCARGGAGRLWGSVMRFGAADGASVPSGPAAGPPAAFTACLPAAPRLAAARLGRAGPARHCPAPVSRPEPSHCRPRAHLLGDPPRQHWNENQAGSSSSQPAGQASRIAPLVQSHPHPPAQAPLPLLSVHRGGRRAPVLTQEPITNHAAAVVATTPIEVWGACFDRPRALQNVRPESYLLRGARAPSRLKRL